MIRRYTDLDVYVERNPKGEGYWVRASIPGKVEWTTFDEPFTEEELEALWNAILEGAPRSAYARKLGRRLFEKVFSGPVRDLLNDNMPSMPSRWSLRLRLRPDPEVWHWPWELLHSPEEFLALSIKTLIVRQPETTRRTKVRRSPYPLRVLVVISNPRDCPQLDGEKELKEIQGALGWLERLEIVEVEKLAPPTLTALLDRLKQKRFHVLHFVGHGRFDPEQGGGALLFEQPDGRADFVEGGKLASVLDGHTTLRLVVLNACEGARSAREDPFSSVAKSLVRKQIPAVVAMQYPIDDAMAVRFAFRFYAGLAAGGPVDWAVTWARKAMYTERSGLDWVIPVLLLSSSDGRIFRWKPSRGLLGALGVVLLMLLGYGNWLSRVAALEPTLAEGDAASLCPGPKTMQMEFVRIHPEPFLMGSETGEDNEKPVHEVTISRQFCIGKFEVTQGQWRQVMGANSVESKFEGDDLPVTMVTYEQVLDFVRRLNRLEGEPIYRLPTEAEWELAARAEDGGYNCLGDPYPDLLPVGSLPSNERGLHDMLGNAWEWVQDWEGPYSELPVTDPTGPSMGTRRIKRGGSHDAAPSHCRPARRNSHRPDGRANDLGFRIVREVRLAFHGRAG